jgi:hypothetical protein
MQQTELQQSLQRFSGTFSDRVSQAMSNLFDSDQVEIRDTALREAILYLSSALSIATGPIPEVNLLDMVVFVRLCGDILEEHWIPTLYGGRGSDVLGEFRKSERELWGIADLVLGDREHRDLVALISSWRAENPEQFRVEGIRLLDFSERAGELAQERAKQTRGLLSGVKSAMQAADQALLIAESAMFLIHRLPFLVRMQVRLTSREVLTDAIDRLTRGPEAPLEVVPRRIEEVVHRSAQTLAIAGAGFALVWWGGYFLAKRGLLRR